MWKLIVPLGHHYMLMEDVDPKAAVCKNIGDYRMLSVNGKPPGNPKDMTSAVLVRDVFIHYKSLFCDCRPKINGVATILTPLSLNSPEHCSVRFHERQAFTFTQLWRSTLSKDKIQASWAFFFKLFSESLGLLARASLVRYAVNRQRQSAPHP